MSKKRCPFCGSKDAAVDRIKLEVSRPYRVVCKTCGAAGPWEESGKEALQGWSKRCPATAVQRSGWRCCEGGRYTCEGG